MPVVAAGLTAAAGRWTAGAAERDKPATRPGSAFRHAPRTAQGKPAVRTDVAAVAEAARPDSAAFPGLV